MGETRKIAAILVADIVGYSRLAGTDEDRTLSRLRGLRSDLIDPASEPLGCNIARLVSLTMRGRTFDGDGGWPRRWPAAGIAASFLIAALAAFLRWLLSIVAQHLCACGFDLRLARAPRLPAAVRRAARLIDDLCRLEARAGLLGRSALVEQLMLLPSLFEPKGRRLTQLSSAERVACLSRAGDDLEHRLCKYLGHDADPAIAVWRSGVIAAGGCDALLRSLCRRLAPQRATARPAVARACEPRTDLLSLVAAYRAIRARRQLLGEAGSASSDARSAHKIPQAR